MKLVLNEELERDSKEEPTLRDQFAMAALTGMLARGFDARPRAQVAYEYADAMLEARAVEGPSASPGGDSDG